MSNGNITLNIVNEMLGLLDETQAIEMIYALQQGNGEKLMQVVNEVANKAGDWDELLREVAEKSAQDRNAAIITTNLVNGSGSH